MFVGLPLMMFAGFVIGFIAGFTIWIKIRPYKEDKDE